MGVLKMEHTLSNRLLRIAVVFAAFGMIWGIYMGHTMSFETKSVHAHLNLVGWVTTALYGLFYRVVPVSAKGKLPLIHFWLHAIGLPIFMVSLATFYLGGTELEQLALAGLAVGPNLVVLGMLLFGVIVFKATSSRTEPA